MTGTAGVGRGTCWDSGERRWRQTILGWVTQVMAQRARQTLKSLWRRGWGLDVQTYTVHPVSFHISRNL